MNLLTLCVQYTFFFGGLASIWHSKYTSEPSLIPALSKLGPSSNLTTGASAYKTQSNIRELIFARSSKFITYYIYFSSLRLSIKECHAWDLLSSWRNMCGILLHILINDFLFTSHFPPSLQPPYIYNKYTRMSHGSNKTELFSISAWIMMLGNVLCDAWGDADGDDALTLNVQMPRID